jgi:hypothetical protein
MEGYRLHGVAHGLHASDACSPLLPLLLLLYVLCANQHTCKQPR